MRRYRFKLYPTAAQAAQLHEQRQMMADLWNGLKQRCEDVYRREKRLLSYFDLTGEITALRDECPEWAAIPAMTEQRVAKWLADAYKAFFRRCKAGEAPGYPRWRARKQGRTIPLGAMGNGWTLKPHPDNPLSWSLHYKSVTQIKSRATWIHARGHLPAEVIDWRNADIVWQDERWWLSVCVEMLPRRDHGHRPVYVEFDLVDDFARVNGVAETPAELIRAQHLQEMCSEMKSDSDRRWPRGKRRSDTEQAEYQRVSAEIAQLSAYMVRVRRDALHVWTARIVERASAITVRLPDLKSVKSPRGDEKSWGASVETVSTFNRHILSFSSSLAASMLQYKAAEAGIPCEVMTNKASTITMGRDLVVAGKELRRARRRVKEVA